MAKVAFLGLGVMGYPMAGHLKNKGGHEVTVYNRTAAKAEQWAKEFGGKAAKTPEEAAAGQDFVMMCVGNDNDVRAVAGATAFPKMGKGTVFVDHTTASAEVARELYAEREEGRLRLHRCAGVGRPGRRAERRAHRDVRRRRRALRPRREGDRRLRAHVQAARARRAPASSPRWSTRSASPAWCRASSEGIHFAKKAGLDVEAVIETISKGAAQSWQMENRYKTMNAGKYDFGFAVDWMRKDLVDLPRRGAALRRAPAGRRAGRPVLFGSAEDGRRALGYVEPDGAAGAVRT